MRVTQLVEFVSGVVATVLNLVLIPIILTKSSQRIGKYKWFLLAYTINACYLATSQFTATPTWYIPHNGYFFISTIDIFPRWIQQIQVMSLVTSYTFNAIILAWSFLYRLAVVEKTDLPNYSARPWIISRRYFPIALTFSILLALYMVGSCKSIMPSPEVDDIFHDEIFNATGIETQNVGYIGGEITIDGEMNVGMAICLASYSLFVFSACTTFIICWHKIGSKLREMRSMAGVNYHFQYRLYVLLTLQTLMPILFNIIPAFLAFVFSLAKVATGDYILIAAMVLSFAQIIDPIFTVMLIADYKQVFVSFSSEGLRSGTYFDRNESLDYGTTSSYLIPGYLQKRRS